jgi:hypothetical protein
MSLLKRVVLEAPAVAASPFVRVEQQTWNTRALPAAGKRAESGTHNQTPAAEIWIQSAGSHGTIPAHRAPADLHPPPRWVPDSSQDTIPAPTRCGGYFKGDHARALYGMEKALRTATDLEPAESTTNRVSSPSPSEEETKASCRPSGDQDGGPA